MISVLATALALATSTMAVRCAQVAKLHTRPSDSETDTISNGEINVRNLTVNGTSISGYINPASTVSKST